MSANRTGRTDGARMLVAALAILSLSHLASGCGGTCQELEGRFDEELRREMTGVGTGLVPIGSGELHLGLTLSGGILDRLSAQLTEALPDIVSRPRQVGSARVEIAAELAVVRFEPQAKQAEGIHLEIELSTSVDVRRPGRRESHFLPGSVLVTSRFDVDTDDEGVPRLVVVFENLIEGSLNLATQSLSEDVGAEVQSFLEPRVASLLLTEIGQLPLLSFPALALGPVRVTMVPAELRPLPQQGALFIGFVTNLRPEAGGTAGPSPVGEDGLVLSVHPHLADAAAELALVDGRLPRQFTEEAEPSPDGPVNVMLESLALHDDRIELVAELWDLGSGACALAELHAEGRARLREEAVDLGLDRAEVRVIEGEGHFEGTPWMRSRFARESVELAQRLLDLSTLQLGNGEVLELRPTSLALGPKRIEVGLAVVE